MIELTAEEVRVLGSLVEKERTVPDSYPLSLNSLLLACNQRTNRDPVVDYSEATVETALSGLRDHGLARRGVYAGSRVPKHRHVIEETLGIDPAGSAILSVLMLRGPQTVGELKLRTERMHGFASLDDVEQAIDRLAAGEEPYVVRLPRRPGQKELRIAHRLGGDVDAVRDPQPDGAADGYDEERNPAGSRSDRVVALELNVAALEARVGSLEGQLGALRAEFDALRAELE
ncbi:MAG: hypothetical protein JWL73_606 [Actinomycetia bacterium]|nr:hypothetical protein [Actinomycetes bacterium]